MAHAAIGAIASVQNLCHKHQSPVEDWRALHTPAAMAAGGVLGSAIGASIGGGKGAVVGGVIGVFVGVAFPELAQPDRLAPIAKKLHLLGVG